MLAAVRYSCDMNWTELFGNVPDLKCDFSNYEFNLNNFKICALDEIFC